jgi:hypothetical protein
MSLALSSAQQNLAKVIAGKGPDSTKIFEYLVENYSGAEFTLADFQKDEDLLAIITPPKPTKKSSGRGAKTSEERTRESYDSDRCDARVWLNGYGGQCTHKKEGESCMCQHHSTEGKWGANLCDEAGNWWLGLVTGSRPENPIRPGGSGKAKAWKTTEEGEVVEKPKKEKKPKMTDEEKEQKAAEKEALKEQKKKEREEKKAEKAEEKKLKAEEKKAEKDVDAILKEVVAKVESEEETVQEVEDEPVSPTPTIDIPEEVDEDTEDVVEEPVGEDTEDLPEPEEEPEYSEISYEDVEYQQHKETGEVLDPEDFSVMGTWNADTQSIDWEDEDAEAQHKDKKESL